MIIWKKKPLEPTWLSIEFKVHTTEGLTQVVENIERRKERKIKSFSKRKRKIQKEGKRV